MPLSLPVLLLVSGRIAEPLAVACPSNCTAALQAALYSGASHVIVHPPSSGGPAVVGSPSHATRLLANGTDMVVEFAPGL
jgi:hypothetical protein